MGERHTAQMSTIGPPCKGCCLCLDQSNPAAKKYDTPDILALPCVVKWQYLPGDMRSGAPYDPCTGANRREVCMYGAGDLQWLLNQQQLFAGKFDPEVDDVAIRCLESVLRF